MYLGKLGKYVVKKFFATCLILLGLLGPGVDTVLPALSDSSHWKTKLDDDDGDGDGEDDDDDEYDYDSIMLT